MKQNKPARCVRWCQRCGGDLGFCPHNVVCLDCGAMNEEVMHPIEDIPTCKHYPLNEE